MGTWREMMERLKWMSEFTHSLRSYKNIFKGHQVCSNIHTARKSSTEPQEYYSPPALTRHLHSTHNTRGAHDKVPNLMMSSFNEQSVIWKVWLQWSKLYVAIASAWFVFEKGFLLVSWVTLPRCIILTSEWWCPYKTMIARKAKVYSQNVYYPFTPESSVY